jgi:trigger factor
MNNIKVSRLPKFEAEILLTIPWAEIKKTYEEVVEDATKRMELKGFRKGKVPKKLVEENLDKSKVYSEVIQRVIPKYYQQIVAEQNFKPIGTPKVSLISAKEEKDWEIKILIAEKPEVKLGNYKEELMKLNQTTKIWVPGKDSPKESEEAKKAKEEEKIQKILSWLLENIKVEISDLVIEEEVNRRLSSLIDQTNKLGLTVEQYLSSTGKTAEEIKNEYRKQASEMWRLEFALNEISDQEKITVENKDIDELIQKASSQEEKKNLEAQRYLLASFLRRQKTLDFLASL